jgi:hypothetical protein
MDCRTEEILVFISGKCDGLLSLQNLKIGSGGHAVSYPMYTRGLLHYEKGDRDVKLTDHMTHNVPTLRMSCSVPPLLHKPSRRAQEYVRLYSIEQRLT